MSLLLPTVSLARVTEITPELLRTMDVKALLLDVDNTLAFHGSQTPFAGTVEWSRRLRGAGIRMMILSNNFEERVRPFARQYGLPFLAMAMKPLPYAYRLAARRLGVAPRRTAAVGDQVFTDILGAHLARMKSILLLPGQKETSFGFRVRRWLEKPVRRKAERGAICEKKNGDG